MEGSRACPFVNLWPPVAACGNGVLAPKQGRLQYPKSNPGGLEYSRPGGLEAWIFEAWRLGSLDWIGVLGGLDWIGMIGGLSLEKGGIRMVVSHARPAHDPRMTVRMT